MAEVGDDCSLKLSEPTFSKSDITESDLFPDLASNTFKSKKDVSVGKYDYDLGLIEITRSKGSAWRSIGGNVGPKLYLFPEEALFLFECNKLEIFGESGQLTKEDAWSIMCPSKQAFHHYIVYAHLKRMSYIVIRHGAYKCTHQNMFAKHVSEMKLKEQVALEAAAKRSKLDKKDQAESSNYEFTTSVFDLYKSGDYFMKTALLKPDNSVAVVASSLPFPTQDQMEKLSEHPNLLLALVTGCNTTIYSYEGGLESI